MKHGAYVACQNRTLSDTDLKLRSIHTLPALKPGLDPPEHAGLSVGPHSKGCGWLTLSLTRQA